MIWKIVWIVLYWIELLLNEFGIKQKEEKFQKSDTIDIILNTSGGYIDVVKFIMDKILRARFKTVNIIVINQALSSGTLLCCGANEILTSNYSSFSMVNPAINGMESYFLKRINPFLHIVSYLFLKDHREKYGINPYKIAIKTEQNVKRILKEFLNNYGIKEPNWLKKQLLIKKTIKNLLFYGKHLTHTDPIFNNELKEYGLNINEATGEILRLMEQYDILAVYMFKKNNLAKLFMTSTNRQLILAKYRKSSSG
jgi:hypothetical protein